MINLVKGDMDSLEGKVLVFSRLESQTGENPILALYAATNPLDFVEKIGAPREMVSDLEKQTKIGAENAIKMIQKELNDTFCPGMKIEPVVLPVYITNIPISSEGDLYLGDEDVIDAGVFSNPAACFEAMTMGVKFYLNKHEDNVGKKHGLNEEKEKADGVRKAKPECERQAPEINYKNIDRREFRRYVTENFVAPILDSYRDGERHRTSAKEAEFIRFSAQTPFASNVVELIDVMGGAKDNPNIPLIEAYVNLIVAVREEDYKTAATMRDRIKEIRNKP